MPKVTVPTLPAPLAKQVFDMIPTTRIYRMWAIPGLNDPEAVPLQMAMSVLGGLSSSRLDNAMVRKDPVAVSVAAFAQPFEDAGILIVQADVKEGVSPRSEEHTSELQSLMRISYAVFCLKKKK